ncbi:MarR family winged helix-turn-helix transcriptional regulator [Fibrella sp. WM1]|uniref:MarR family winged helix-turn-helix transcriptional regulator n=1 Tax=Fibrella musci TaxID=3242485 RepID=UPI0035225A8C
MHASSLDKPIGYWIKKADDVLTSHIDAVQQQFGLTRLSWQLLHTICTRPPLSVRILAELVSPFAPVSDVQQVLAALTNQGLLTWDEHIDSVPVCTPSGVELHSRCFAQQTQIRQQAMEDITNEQYALTVQTLQAIVHNLEQLSETTPNSSE